MKTKMMSAAMTAAAAALLASGALADAPNTQAGDDLPINAVQVVGTHNSYARRSMRGWWKPWRRASLLWRRR